MLLTQWVLFALVDLKTWLEVFQEDMEVFAMQDGKADEYKKSLGSEIYLLNQDYGFRSGCLWNYKHKEESVVLYPRPFGVDEETYNEYSDAYTNISHKMKEEETAMSGYMFRREFKSEEEAFAYLAGVRMGVDLMIESILGANSKIKMIF